MDSNFLEQIVFSSKYVLKEKSPILYVSHDIEGDWQFFGNEKNLKTEDGVVLFMKEIIELDPTIKEVLDIPKGAKAYRTSINNPWIKE